MDSKKLGTIIGQIIGTVLFGCLTACACAAMLGLTFKFIMWMF